MKQKVLLLILLTLGVCGTTVFGQTKKKTPIKRTATTGSTTKKVGNRQNSLSRELKTEDDGFQYYLTKSNGKYGAEDKNKKTLIPISRGYSNVWYYEGWFYIKRNGAEGICDISGKEIIVPDKYSFVTFRPAEGHTGWFYVTRNGAEGVCDMSGKEIIAPDKYSSVSFRPEEGITGWFCVYRNGAEGACDISGKEIIAPDKYSKVYFHPKKGHTGYFGVEIDGEEGACDMTGREIIPCKFKNTFFSDSKKCFKYENSAGDFIELDIKLDVLGKAYGSDIGLSSSPSSYRSDHVTKKEEKPQKVEEKQTIIIEQHGPVQVWVACGGCQFEPGKCTYCHGSGWGYNNRLCSRCGGNGKCTICGGSGGHYEMQYQ